MKKNVLYLLLVAMAVGPMASCENDDSDFSDYTLVSNDDDDDDEEEDDDAGETTVSDSIFIAFNGTTASVSNDARGVVSISGADVTVRDEDTEQTMVLVLSGTTADGSLLVYRSAKYTMVLNGVDITNVDGPAINNQCGKALYLVCADGTMNHLADGTTYATMSYDQKGALFSEGQLYFSGAGTLSVNGYCRNAIASDDYITIDGDIVLNATTAATGTNGIKANDGMFINGGTLTVSVAADGGRGIRCEARTVITGGTTTITTSGKCKIEVIDGVRDTTSAACIKSDSLFTMTGGTLLMSSSGDGGKGVNCGGNIVVSGGIFSAKTTGSNDVGKPKAVKSDTGIIVSGGSFTATVKKSWACDNGYENDTLKDAELALKRITVEGSPTTASITKTSVKIVY